MSASERLFFALWPDEQTRTTIARLLRRVNQHHGGKQVHSDNLHLTLVFLGNVQLTQRQCVEKAADTISIMPFRLCLDHVGLFRGPRVVWLGIKETPDALKQLATNLQGAARHCGIQLDEKPFTPHVSLLRKVTQLNALHIEPVSWDVNEFCLVHSVSGPEGVEYRVVKTWGGC